MFTAEEEFVRRFLPHRQTSAASETMICESPTQIALSEAAPTQACGEGCRIDLQYKGPLVVRLAMTPYRSF